MVGLVTAPQAGRGSAGQARLLQHIQGRSSGAQGAAHVGVKHREGASSATHCLAWSASRQSRGAWPCNATAAHCLCSPPRYSSQLNAMCAACWLLLQQTRCTHCEQLLTPSRGPCAACSKHAVASLYPVTRLTHINTLVLPHADMRPRQEALKEACTSAGVAKYGSPLGIDAKLKVSRHGWH